MSVPAYKYIEEVLEGYTESRWVITSGDRREITGMEKGDIHFFNSIFYIYIFYTVTFIIFVTLGV